MIGAAARGRGDAFWTVAGAVALAVVGSPHARQVDATMPFTLFKGRAEGSSRRAA